MNKKEKLRKDYLSKSEAEVIDNEEASLQDQEYTFDEDNTDDDDLHDIDDIPLIEDFIDFDNDEDFVIQSKR
jgi:hypothetical protein